MESIPEVLIVDANILFSFFKLESVRRYVMEELLNLDCELISPKFVFEELFKNKQKLMKFSQIDDSEFDFLYSLLEQEIKVAKESEYKEFLLEANKLSPHKEDTKDDSYFALSLAFNKTPIWSDEKAFKQQSEIKVLSTKDLLKLLKLA
ncbi:hypothetical protein HYT23_05695 [Candidatus Pacearchaeota archaeon]|nr:hypothetical protein [Candidatus Pacearchaeota archaeon]